MLNINSSSEDIRETRNLDELRQERLTVKTFPLNGYAIYITFPDGKNMLIDTASPEDRDILIHLLKEENKSKIIDYIIITKPEKNRTGGLEDILNNFKVREIITALGTEDIKWSNDLGNLPALSNCIQRNLVDNEELFISSVKVVALGPRYSERETNLCLRLSYHNSSFLFVPDISKAVQKKIFSNYSASIRSTVLSKEKSLIKNFEKGVGANFLIRPNKENVIITDGYLFYISGSEETGLKEIEKYYQYGISNLSRGNYNEAISELNKAVSFPRKGEEIDRIKKKAQIKLQKAYEKKDGKINQLWRRAVDYYNQRKYEQAVVFIQKILVIEPADERCLKLMKKAEEEIADTEKINY